MNRPTMLQKALDTYGGAARWQSAAKIRAVVSADGWAFTLKRRVGFDHSVFECKVHEPWARLSSIGRTPGVSAQLHGHDVTLVDAQGQVLASRPQARRYFSQARRWLWWDDMDMGYFACYAFWNYFTLPALFTNPDMRWVEINALQVEAHFPESIPSHSPVQRFRFDSEGRLLQHDYTAQVISGLATAANCVLSHSTTADGVLYPSQRLVTPRSPSGKPLPAPGLIRIQVHELHMFD